MGRNMKKDKELFDTILAAVFSIIGLALMLHHYFTFGG